MFIGWERPNDNWVKLNRDRDCKSNRKIAGCGRLLRHSYGLYGLKDLIEKIETCDAFHAKMQGPYLRLDMA